MEKDLCKTKSLWGDTATWKTVNRNLDDLIRLHRPKLDQAITWAQDIQIWLESIFFILDNLCAVTCPWCPDPCCLRANVWIDFKDLLFLHLNGYQIPPAQISSNLKETCGYWRPNGCKLPRIARPWVCTWYLCPTQTANLRQQPKSIQNTFNRAVQAIKTARKEMESEFIRIVS